MASISQGSQSTNMTPVAERRRPASDIKSGIKLSSASMARMRGPTFSSKKAAAIEKKSQQATNQNKNHLKDQMVVQGDFFNARVSQYCYYEANMKRIRSKLSKTQKEILRKESCLAEIALDHEHTFWCKQIIHSVLLRQLKADEESKIDNSIYFNFAGNKVKFGKREFALITGLKMGDYDSEYAKFQAPNGPCAITKYLKPQGSKHETTYDEIFKAYDSIDASFSNDEVVSMTLLLLYTSINGAPKRNSIDDKMVHLACNWRQFDEMPWGELSYRATVDSARKSMLNALKQSKDSKNRTYTVGGFPVALGVFAYELMPHFERFLLVYKVETLGCKPRMFRWRGVNTTRAKQEIKHVWDKRTITGEKVKVTPINPTPEERAKFLQWEDEEEIGEEAEFGGEEEDAFQVEKTAYEVSDRKRVRTEDVAEPIKRPRVSREEKRERRGFLRQMLKWQEKCEVELKETKETKEKLIQNDARIAELEKIVKHLTATVEHLTATVEHLSAKKNAKEDDSQQHEESSEDQDEGSEDEESSENQEEGSEDEESSDADDDDKKEDDDNEKDSTSKEQHRRKIHGEGFGSRTFFCWCGNFKWKNQSLCPKVINQTDVFSIKNMEEFLDSDK